MRPEPRPQALPPRPSAILKDWDGTFFDSLGRVHTVHNTVLAELGHAPVDFQTTVRMTAYGAVGAKHVLGLTDDEVRQVQKRFEEIFFQFDANSITLMPGAAEFYVAMPAYLPLGVVSNKEGNLLRQEIAHLGWDSKIKVAIGFQEATANKPAPEPALLALQRMQVQPDKSVWFIGDTHGDVLCAQAAGLTAVLVTDHHYDGPQPCFQYRNLNELLDVYQQVANATA